MAEIAKVFKELYDPYDFKVFWGGRGGAKSWGFAQALLLKGSKEKLLILCTRELQDSIQDSVHRLLSNLIVKMGLSGFYDIKQKVIRGKNGTEFIFEGLKNNVKKIKSLEGVSICWCEEAENISEFSWDVLIPTIRQEKSEIWISFNLDDAQDYTYQNFVINPQPNSIVKKVSWRDNPWFPENLRKKKDELYKRNYKKYLHVWEGEEKTNYEDSIIQPEWIDAAIDAHLVKGFKPMGIRTLGFDPADIGGDEKAIAIRHGSVVEEVRQWAEGNVSDAIDKAFNYAFDGKVDYVVFDSIGVGAGVKVGLDKRIEGKHLKIHGYCAAEKVDNPYSCYEDDRLNKDVFRNKRAQYFWLLRDRFERTYRSVVNNEYVDPDLMISLSSKIKNLPELKSELASIQRKRGQNSFIQLESKADMKADKRKSPNLTDALVMAFANPPPTKRNKGKLQYPKLAII